MHVVPDVHVISTRTATSNGRPMETIAAAVALHSLAMGMGMSIPQAFFPAGTATAAFVAMVADYRGRKTEFRPIATKITIASLLFVLVLGLAVGPREWLYESMGAFYLIVLVVCTFSGRNDAGEAISGCMLSVVLAAAASADSTAAIGFRWAAAAGAIAASLSCIVRIFRGTARPANLALATTGGPFDIELAVARMLALPLLLTVVYSQSTERHALNAGEAVAALIVAVAVISAKWEK